MRQRYFIILFGIFLAFVLVVSLEPILLFLVKKELKSRLGADTVTIGQFQLASLREIVFGSILIEKKESFSFKAQQVRIGFHFLESRDKRIVKLHIENASLDYGKFSLQELFLRLDRARNDGKLSITKMRFNKITVTDFQSPAQIEGQSVVLSGISAVFFNGLIGGNAYLKLAFPLPEYRAHLQFSDLSIVRVIADLDVGKKVEMTGFLDGDMQVAGRGSDVAVLAGAFRTDEPGGKLIIKDRRLLENVVDQAYLETVVETLQDYEYNAGGLVVTLEEKALITDIELNGPKGKRDFKVVYHR